MQFPVALAHRLQIRAVVVVEKLVGRCDFFALQNGKDVFSVDLSITGGNVEEETPAQFRERHAAERQRDAEIVIQRYANVQPLLDEFDGRIDGVRAVDVPNNSDGAR